MTILNSKIIVIAYIDHIPPLINILCPLTALHPITIH